MICVSAATVDHNPSPHPSYRRRHCTNTLHHYNHRLKWQFTVFQTEEVPHSDLETGNPVGREQHLSMPSSNGLNGAVRKLTPPITALAVQP